MATANVSETIDMDAYRIQFSDGIISVFRRVDAGSDTDINGTTVKNTCLARSIAYAQAMATMGRPANAKDTAYWVRRLGCTGDQLDVVQEKDCIAENLGIGVRLRVAFGNGNANVAHALDITRVDDAVVNNEALRRDAVIMHERIGPDCGHFVALIPVDSAPPAPPAPPAHESWVTKMEKATIRLDNGLVGPIAEVNALGVRIRDNPDGVEIIAVPCRAGKTLVMLYRIAQAFDAGRSVVLFLHHPEIAAATTLYHNIVRMVTELLHVSMEEARDRFIHVPDYTNVAPGQFNRFRDSILANGRGGRCMVITLNDARTKKTMKHVGWNDVDPSKFEIFIDEPQCLWTGRKDKKVEKQLDLMFEKRYSKLKLVSATHLDTVLLMDFKFGERQLTVTKAEPAHLASIGYRGLTIPGFIEPRDPGKRLEKADDLWRKKDDKKDKKNKDKKDSMQFATKDIEDFFDDFVRTQNGYCLVIGDTFAKTDRSVHNSAAKLAKTLSGAGVVVVGLSAGWATVCVGDRQVDAFVRDAALRGSLMANVFAVLERAYADRPWIVVSNQADRGSLEYRRPHRTITHVVMGYNATSELQRRAQGIGRAFGYCIPHKLQVLTTQTLWDSFVACITRGQDALLDQYDADEKVLDPTVFKTLGKRTTRIGAPNNIAHPELRKRMRAAADDDSAVIVLPEEFLCETVAALIEKADDLIAYIERLKEELKARGLKTPTHYVFEDSAGNELEWRSDPAESGSVQVHVVVKPHVPAVSYPGSASSSYMPKRQGVVSAIRDAIILLRQTDPSSDIFTRTFTSLPSLAVALGISDADARRAGKHGCEDKLIEEHLVSHRAHGVWRIVSA